MSLPCCRRSTDFWRWQPHPEVWVLVGGVVVLAIYALRVDRPQGGAGGTARRHAGASSHGSCSGVALLWFASDWPMHDIAEEYLFSVHMTQHMLLTFVVPPVFLLATPSGWRGWCSATAGSSGRSTSLARPVPAAVLFNGLLLLYPLAR